MSSGGHRQDFLRLLERDASLPLKSGYSYRPQQEEMAQAIYEALLQKEHLLVEAGTGTGKSLAYLLPLLQFAFDEKVRVAVSTETLSLQYQILNKELPFIREATGRSISAEICLGAGNYVCKRRLSENLNSGSFSPESLKGLDDFLQWERSSPTGVRQEYGKPIDPLFWRKISRDPEDCLGSRCPFYDISPHFVARRRWHKAQLLIVNHSLLSSHFASGNRILPQFHYLVIDEAHRFPEIIQRHFALSIDSAEIAALFQELSLPPQALQLAEGFLQELCSHYDITPGGYRRIGVELELDSGFRLIELVDKAKKDTLREIEILESQLELHLSQDGQEGTGAERLELEAEAPGAAGDGANRDSVGRDSAAGDSAGADGADTGDVNSAGGADTRLPIRQLRAQSRLKRLSTLYDLLEKLMSSPDPLEVLWVVRSSHSGRSARSASGDSIRITSMPLESGPAIREKALPSLASAIFTSSTLGAQSDAPFRYFLKELGFAEEDAPQCLRIESPFNYERQALFYLPRNISDPVNFKERYYRDIARESHRLLELSGGGAFVLFTSAAALQAVHALLQREREAGSRAGYTLLSQLELGASAALSRFLSMERGALLGLATFWQGIDIPGRQLRLVILTRIPFRMPDEPLLAARLETERERGGNPFASLQLPVAILNIRQGFGRLIRSHRDRGIVALLDPRIHSRSYGSQILASLPPAARKADFASLQTSYEQLLQPGS